MSSNSSESRSVLVTGASGYIARHIVRILLDRGWHVAAGVRNLQQADEIRDAIRPHLNHPERADNALTFVALDLNSDDGWQAACSGMDALVHTASPFPMVQPDNPEELIRPAVDGALRALRSAKAADVRRVILTSSSAAITGGELPADRSEYDETDWTDTEDRSTSAYSKSKTLAEHAAWQYVANDGKGIDLTVINPGFVLGAPLGKRYGTSVGVVERILKAKDPALPDLGFASVDIRDLAEAHVRALERPETIGERIAVVGKFLQFRDMATAVKETFPDRKTVTYVAPHFVIRLIAIFDKAVRTILPDLGKRSVINNAKAGKLLGIEFRDPRESVVETAKFLISEGLVK